jgi:hypothetical protein
MKNHQSQTIRKFGPASTSDVLPPVQRYAPACRAEASGESGLRNTEHAPVLRSAFDEGGSRPEQIQADPSRSVHQPGTRASRPKTRNGKIARLPCLVRDMVNRMLRNNIPHPKIVDALDEHGITVTQRNVSNWKTRGGYREWCAQQDQALETHLSQDNLIGHLRTTDATQLSEVGLQLAATQLSQLFLKQDASKQLTADPEKFSTAVNALCRLNRQLYRLQKYRDDSARELGYKHDPERLKREAEKDLEITRNVYSAAKLGQSIHEPDIPHRNFIPKSSYAYLAQGDSDQVSDGPPVNPLTILSDLASAMNKATSSKPEAPSVPNPLV